MREVLSEMHSETLGVCLTSWVSYIKVLRSSPPCHPPQESEGSAKADSHTDCPEIYDLSYVPNLS